jgi:molybdate transport system substrate-binding protein
MNITTRWLALCLALGLCGVTRLAHAEDASQPGLLVFGAASLSNVLDELGAAYTAETGQAVKGSYAASSAAIFFQPAAHLDMFFSADAE